MNNELIANNEHKHNISDETNDPNDRQMYESNPVTNRKDNVEALPLKSTETVDGYHRQEGKSVIKDCLNSCGALTCLANLAGLSGGSVYVHDCPKNPAIPCHLMCSMLDTLIIMTRAHLITVTLHYIYPHIIS
ncbi:unnamed protein product [Oppiella nova]|uniref:Uncharacterized protein n=1 Tax=Oppiella nova TaxID=334625 RepID=A0A7R9M9S8_9ACAR|nr:unnamed protein product [Oppiella nova]CAG2172885.1 unnamed protein product [Oppiella nova]